MFAVSGMLKLFADLCGLVGPLSITFIVDFIDVQVSNATRNEMDFLNDTTDVVYPAMTNYPTWTEFIDNGWIMSGIILIAFLLQGTFSQASTNLINIEGMKIKNALQGLIYRKTLSSSASCFYTTGKSAKNENDGPSTAGADREQDDDDYDLNNPGTITNLMSDDSLNVMTFFWICHYVWSIPLKVRSRSGGMTNNGQSGLAFYGALIAS